MGDWKEEFKEELLEAMKKDARQNAGENVARICIGLPEEKYSDEKISKMCEVPLHRVKEIREEYQTLEFAKTLEITAEPQYVDEDLTYKCLPKSMWVKWGYLDGGKNMLLLGLFATGLSEFLELLTVDVKETLRQMLNEGSNSNYY